MAEKPQFGPATPASTPAESAAQKHADATGERKFRIPPDFHDVTAERFSKTAAIIGYPVATPREASNPVPPPLQFPPHWKVETVEKTSGTTTIIGTAPPGKDKPARPVCGGDAHGEALRRHRRSPISP
jgi:hypothetical protein